MLDAFGAEKGWMLLWMGLPCRSSQPVASGQNMLSFLMRRPGRWCKGARGKRPRSLIGTKNQSARRKVKSQPRHPVFVCRLHPNGQGKIVRFSKSKCRCSIGSRAFCSRKRLQRVAKVVFFHVSGALQSRWFGCEFCGSLWVTPQVRCSPFFVGGQRGQEYGTEGDRSSGLGGHGAQDAGLQRVCGSRRRTAGESYHATASESEGIVRLLELKKSEVLSLSNSVNSCLVLSTSACARASRVACGVCYCCTCACHNLARCM